MQGQKTGIGRRFPFSALAPVTLVDQDTDDPSRRDASHEPNTRI